MKKTVCEVFQPSWTPRKPLDALADRVANVKHYFYTGDWSGPWSSNNAPTRLESGVPMHFVFVIFVWVWLYISAVDVMVVFSIELSAQVFAGIRYSFGFDGTVLGSIEYPVCVVAAVRQLTVKQNCFHLKTGSGGIGKTRSVCLMDSSRHTNWNCILQLWRK